MGTSVDRLEELLDYRCSDVQNESLVREFTDEEVRKVFFSMPSNKFLGPDCYKCEFFRAAWHVIGKYFIVAIQSFFRKDFLPKGINLAILALIPKKDDAKEMKDYRLISCCNIIYKVISKINANRLKEILPDFTAPNQSMFVKDRLLMENVLLATELVKDYHKDTVAP